MRSALTRSVRRTSPSTRLTPPGRAFALEERGIRCNTGVSGKTRRLRGSRKEGPEWPSAPRAHYNNNGSNPPAPSPTAEEGIEAPAAAVGSFYAEAATEPLIKPCEHEAHPGERPLKEPRRPPGNRTRRVRGARTNGPRLPPNDALPPTTAEHRYNYNHTIAPQTRDLPGKELTHDEDRSLRSQRSHNPTF